MSKRLQDLDAKVCWTAAGCLIIDGKILMIKHKKLGRWLCPGGHVDENELPHQAAEREFFEETGVKVEAYGPDYLMGSSEVEYVPNPIVSNLHWVSRENYESRLNKTKQTKDGKKWKSCEQHLGFFYLVRSLGDLELTKNEKETDGVGWFSLEDLDTIPVFEEVKQEIQLAFELASHPEK